MGKEPSSYARVCSKQFREEDFVYRVGARMFGWKKRCLEAGAVPSKNLPVCSLDRPRTERHQIRKQQSC
ncbi:hypothetical protein MRX96_013464 [Rhipicephalus microplus]